MTNKEEWKEFLSKFKIEFNDEEDGSVTLYKGEHNVHGYQGFFISIEFNKDDEFIAIGAWE